MRGTGRGFFDSWALSDEGGIHHTRPYSGLAAITANQSFLLV